MQPKLLSRTAGEGGPSPQGWVGEGTGVLGDEAIFDIARDRSGVALTCITPAAAAAGFEHQHIVGVDHEADFLGLDCAVRPSIGIERIAVRQAVRAAEDAASAMAHAVPGGVADRRLGGFDDHLDDPARPAAEFAGAPRVGAKFVATEKQREAHLGHFETAELDPACRLPFAGPRPAVAGRRRPAAGPRLKEMPDERLIGSWILALDRDAKAT